jgi:hypothetical protein
MGVAGGKFAEGVANTDDGAAVKLVVRHTFAFDPTAVGKTVSVLSAKPLLAT